MRLSPALRVLLGFATGALLLAAAAALGISGGRGYLDAAASVDRLQHAARAAGDLRLHVHDAAYRERSFLQAVGAEPYRRANADIDNALGDLRTALVNEPRLTSALAGVSVLLASRRANVEHAAAAPPDDTGTRIQTFSDADAVRADTAFDNAFAAFDRALTDRIATETERRRERGTVMQRGLWLVVAVLVMLFSAAYAVVLSELRERRRLSRRLRQIATHDTLTGLPNRRFFGEWLGYAIAHARREQSQVGLLFVNIDGMKAVNSLHGRVGTHALLREVARRFRATAREGDLLARVGPGEFALATPNARDDTELASLAQRLRDALTDPAQPVLADVPIGASIGVAFFPNDADDTAGIMAAADAAMFSAKRAGDNRIAFNPLEQAA